MKKTDKKYILKGLELKEGVPDKDAPELGEDFFKNAKPFKEEFPEFHASWKKSRGRPKVAAPKKIKSFKLSPDLIDAIVSSGKGYNGRVETALRNAVNQGQI